MLIVDTGSREVPFYIVGEISDFDEFKALEPGFYIVNGKKVIKK